MLPSLSSSSPRYEEKKREPSISKVRSEDDVTARAMFGDVFGQRADYSKGIVYGSRRKYLTINPVRPPDHVLNKEQARKDIHHKTLDEFKQKMNTMYLKTNLNPEEEGGSTHAAAKPIKSSISARIKTLPPPREMIVIEKYSTTDKRKWIETLEAGVKIYTNKETGEVFEECPWQVAALAQAHDHKSNSANAFMNGRGLARPASRAKKAAAMNVLEQVPVNTHEDPKELGTGCLIYDGFELEELFKALDQAKASKSKLRNSV